MSEKIWRDKSIEPNLERMSRDINNISKFISLEESGYTRISFSNEDCQAREHIAWLMENEANLTVRIDAVGNLIGRREGTKQKPVILVGSHLDTVRGGGRFDGVSGIIAGIEVARRFEEIGVETLHPLEIIVFLAEEPSPFGISTLGSRGMAGTIPSDILTILKDDKGRTLETAIREMGGHPEKIAEAIKPSDEVLAYLELHIEQGPLLFSRGIPVGVVEGIFGIYRGSIEVVGRSDHSGTIPMEVRKDALAGASEVILGLEKVCNELNSVVGTIGNISVFPNCLNVIPGRVTVGMEVRGPSQILIDKAVSLFGTKLNAIRDKREIQINFEGELSSKPVTFNSKMVDLIEKVCKDLDVPHMRIISGAGHDANHIAEIAPAGMIFIPSRDGRSHCPEEWSEFEHIGLGTKVLACTIIKMDTEADI